MTPWAVYPPLHYLCLCCTTLAGLRLQWIETTRIVAKMRVRILSYLYPPSPEKLQAGLSHQMGRAGEMERKKKKKKRKEVDTGSSLKRKLKADFLHVSIPGYQSENVFVSMYMCHPVCSASLVKSNYRWPYWKVSNSRYMSAVQSHSKTRYHLSIQTHISIRHVWSHLCVARSKGHRGQDFQMFPIIPQPWRDLPGHPTLCLSLLRIKKEGQKLTNLLATRFHCSLYWAGFTKTWVSVGKKQKDRSFYHGKPSFFMVSKENPLCLPNMTPLTIFLS